MQYKNHRTYIKKTLLKL